MTSKAVIFLLITLGNGSFSHKILCVFPLPSKSHDNLGKAFVNTLLAEGHEVTWITPYPREQMHMNLTVILVPETLRLLEGLSMKGDSERSKAVVEFARNVTIVTAKNKGVVDTLEREKFDAVVVEWFMSDANCGFAAVQQVPLILVNGFPMTPYMEFVIDDIRSIPIIPASFSELPLPMNLWQRLENTYLSLSMIFRNWWLDFPAKSSAYAELFSPIAKDRGIDLPPLLSVLYNTSIYFINSHPLITPALSVPTNVIEIGGYHIEEDIPPLPKDLQKILDESSKGVVYFSMGSVLKPSSFPEGTQRELLRMLGELPCTVLWKFEGELEEVPSNVHIRPWMPQTSILAHPSVRLFITHSGMLSTLEAVQFGVPVLAIPVFGDQPANSERLREAGMCRKVPFSHHMAQEIKDQAIIMLEDQRYFNKAKELSAIFRNRPVSPRKLITHYVDLAIKSKGAPHLRSKSHLYTWYQRWMIDQLLLVLTSILLLYAIIKKMLLNIFSTKQKNREVKSKRRKNR